MKRPNPALPMTAPRVLTETEYDALERVHAAAHTPTCGCWEGMLLHSLRVARAALARVGVHPIECDWFPGGRYLGPPRACSCGLNAALGEPPA